MKKNLFFLMLGISTVLFAASCSKADPGPAPIINNDVIANTNTKIEAPVPINLIEGKWVGGSYNPVGGPVNYFVLNFKPGGILSVETNNSFAYGTWTMAGNNIMATYTFGGESIITYSLAGTYSNNSGLQIIEGSIGIGTSTTGSGVFSVTKE